MAEVTVLDRCREHVEVRPGGVPAGPLHAQVAAVHPRRPARARPLEPADRRRRHAAPLLRASPPRASAVSATLSVCLYTLSPVCLISST